MTLHEVLKTVNGSLKGLSISQPYPALLLTDHKHNETRSWKTNYRGPVLIHASKTRNKTYLQNKALMDMAGDLYFGCGIAVGNLVDCIPITEEYIATLPPDELQTGFYSPGRYAWVFENVHPIDPVPMKGRLGLWNYKPEESEE